MSNVVDGDTGTLITGNTQDRNYIENINTKVVADSGFVAKLFGSENNPMQKELDKIAIQTKIITEMTKANAEIATVIENQKKQLILDMQRIYNDFSGIMSDLQKSAMLTRAKKINELADLYISIVKEIKQKNYEKEMEEKLIAMAEEDWKSRISIIESIFNNQPQRNNHTALY